MITFIKNLQNADEITRKKWLVVFTAVGALAVIVLWLMYLNVAVIAVEQPAGIVVQEAPGFLRIFSKGLTIVSGKTTTGLANSYVYFNEKARTENKFTVDRGSHQFVYDGLEPLPYRALP